MRQAFGNLRWYLCLIWRTDKSYFFPFTMQALALMVTPVVAVLLPQVLLRDIMGGELLVFARDFGFLCAAAMLSSFLVVYYNFKKEDFFKGLNLN